MVEKSPPPQARDKLTFLLALVPFLMDRERVSVQEAAKQFGVSDSQVRDAVRLIAVSGIPGDTSTYQHDDLFDIAWDEFDDNDQIVLTNLVAIDDSPRFSGREAAALIAGLQYLSALPEHADRHAIAALMAKLSRGSSAAPSQVAVEASESDAALAVIRDAVSTERQLEFEYLNSRGDRESRKVDPLRIESIDADWYLRAYCHLREALRTFRIDRISGLTITDEQITYRARDVELPDSLFEGSPEDLEVHLEIALSALPLVADYLLDGSVSSSSGDLVHATMRVSHFHAVKRLVSGMPGLVTVTGPPEARELIAEWALAGARRYDDSY